MSHRERTRARMRAVLERWRSSGESGAAFSRRHGIAPQKLSYWKRALAGPSRRAVRPARTAQSDFVPVRLMDGVPEAAGGSVEIVMGNGCRLVVREGVSLELLSVVLAVLRQAC